MKVASNCYLNNLQFQQKHFTVVFSYPRFQYKPRIIIDHVHCTWFLAIIFWLCSDGAKMSKRKKNYPEPTLIVDKYGADAVR